MKLKIFVILIIGFFLMIFCSNRSESALKSEAESGKEVFLTFKSADPQLKSLKDFIVEKAGPPDNYLPLENNQFLANVTDVPNSRQGLYFIDMKQRRIEKIFEGLPTSQGIGRVAGKRVWLLLTSSSWSSGIMSTVYAIIYLNRVSGSNEPPKCQVLVKAMEDPEGSLCGGAGGRAHLIGLKTAKRIESHTIKDINQDGSEDISFAITEENCGDGKKKNYTKTYLFDKGGFKEKP